MYGCMYGSMSRWIVDGGMGVWIGEWMDGWVGDGWMIDRWGNRWMKGWVGRWRGWCMGGWRDGWVYGQVGG